MQVQQFEVGNMRVGAGCTSTARQQLRRPRANSRRGNPLDNPTLGFVQSRSVQRCCDQANASAQAVETNHHHNNLGGAAEEGCTEPMYPDSSTSRGSVNDTDALLSAGNGEGLPEGSQNGENASERVKSGVQAASETVGVAYGLHRSLAAQVCIL